MAAIPALDLHVIASSPAPHALSSPSPTPLRGSQKERSVLRQRAFGLYCQGWRAPAIARQLSVPERTVRSWLAAARAELRADSSPSYADQLVDAVEGLRAILLAAWQAYERDSAVDDGLLSGRYDYLKRRRVRRSALRRAPLAAAETGDEIISETYARPHVATRGPTYLRLALATQREIAPSSIFIPAASPPVPRPRARPQRRQRRQHQLSDPQPQHLCLPHPLLPSSRPRANITIRQNRQLVSPLPRTGEGWRVAPGWGGLRPCPPHPFPFPRAGRSRLDPAIWQ